jgi:hypothetical protein
MGGLGTLSSFHGLDWRDIIGGFPLRLLDSASLIYPMLESFLLLDGTAPSLELSSFFISTFTVL